MHVPLFTEDVYALPLHLGGNKNGAWRLREMSLEGMKLLRDGDVHVVFACRTVGEGGREGGKGIRAGGQGSAEARIDI